MAKKYKLMKNGETIYPCSITDAIVNPNTRNTVTEDFDLVGLKFTTKRDTSIGKNMFNKNDVKNSLFINASGVLSSSPYYVVSNFIPVKPLAYYILSGASIGGAYNAFYDENLKFLSAFKENAVESPKNAKWARLSISNTAINTAQFEQNEHATAYEEYTDDYYFEQQIKEILLSINNSSSDILYVGKNIFNKSKSITIDSSFTPTSTDNLDDVVLRKASVVQSKIQYNSTYALTTRLYFGNNQEITFSGCSNINVNTAYYFDKYGNYIGAGGKVGKAYQNEKEGAYYVRFRILETDIERNLQAEYGSEATEYEPYAKKIEEEYLPDDLVRKEEYENVKKQVEKIDSELELFVKLEEGKNLYNTNNDSYTVTQEEDSYIMTNNNTGEKTDISQIIGSVYDTLPDGMIKGITFNTNGTGWAYNKYYSTTPKFKFNGNSQLTISGNLNQSFLSPRQFRDDGTFMKSSAIKESDGAYVRWRIDSEDVNKNIQVEYGSEATEYEPYTDPYMPNKYLPKEVVREYTTLILPTNLYFMANKKQNLYYRQAINCSSQKKDVLFQESRSDYPVYDRQLNGTLSTEITFNNTLKIISDDKTLYEKVHKFIVVTAPSLAKKVKILATGNSITYNCFHLKALNEYLSADNVACTFLGTINVGIEDIYCEAQSGGNLNFISNPLGDAVIIHVSGVTTPPLTGDRYTASNGVEWTVRGTSLKINNGTYSGKIKFGDYIPDPNYGETGGTGNDADLFPRSGTMTKTKGNGDSKISYSQFDKAHYNPFWNPDTNELDFEYYFGYWEIEVPDIFILQWTRNDISTKDRIENAPNILKSIVDKFHTSYPTTKIIVASDSIDQEHKHYSNDTYAPGNDIIKFNTLKLFKQYMDIFQTDEYSNYVYLLPVYAKIDSVYGFGPLVEYVLNELYPNAKEYYLKDGYDGVHPPYEYGAKEIALAYEPLIIKLLQ